MLLQYSRIAIFSAAFITQLLAMLGIAAPVNTLVWSYGVFMLMSFINGLYLMAMFFAYTLIASAVISGNDTEALIV